MKKKDKTYLFFRSTAFGLAVVYLLITVGHLFFAPQFRGDVASANNHVSTSNSTLIYNLIRTNRCTFEVKNTVQQSFKVSPANFVKHIKPTLSQANKLDYNHHFLPDHRSVWLSNRILRI